MNLKNQRIRALRSSIEHLNWMMEQPQYEKIKDLMLARKKLFQDELKMEIEGELS